jgi:quercetin dioxygenase-like cupin family protein
MATRARRGASVAAACLAALLLAACGGGSDEAAPSAEGSEGQASAGQEVLLEAQQLTVLDQQVKYPKKSPAQISSAIVQLEPGQESGWHRHNVPLYSYVLEGTVSIEYDAGVTKEIAAGTAFMEAQGVFHNVTNRGDAPARILEVYLGADGAKNRVERTP